MLDMKEGRNFIRMALSLGLSLPGTDPMTAARGKVLLMAHAAELLAYVIPGETAEKVLQGYASKLFDTHDNMAGMRWYSMPWTVRAGRRNALDAVERAVMRAAIRQLALSLEGYIRRNYPSTPAETPKRAEKAN